MDAHWRDPNKEPPLGVPLMVTIRRDWQGHNETLACVCYYLEDPRDHRRYYFEAGDVQNGRIGPDHIQVVAWTLWPSPWMDGIALR